MVLDDVVLKVRMLCQSCGGSGLHAFHSVAKPRWCRCTKSSGPIVAAPGTVVRFTFESTNDAAFRERARLVSNAEREARDDLTSRWVRCGSGWRELPMTSPKRRALESAYAKTRKALVAVQRECSHPSRSLFATEFCDVCHAHVESDVEQHRHEVREGFLRGAA